LAATGQEKKVSNRMSSVLMSMYQLSFYVPESHLETVKNALFAVGAGHFGAYDQCCWQVLGSGQFRPLDGSRPFVGEVGTLHQSREYKVEMICTVDVIAVAVRTLLIRHPYEQPAYQVMPLLSERDFAGSSN
jgi:hypothetical protein